MLKHVTPGKHKSGETVYERYLRTTDLLSLQKSEEDLAHHDELQFQIVHQVFELWWKEAAFELLTINRLLQQHNIHEATRLLHRVIRIQHLMIENLHMLETMRPWDFHAFRKVLEDGAGTDSPGFHELIKLSPPLWNAFKAVIESDGVSLEDVYMQRAGDPQLLACAEALFDYDEIFQLFRMHHFKLAQRMIGPDATGTGGTTMSTLALTLKDIFYPELWEVRNRLTQLANAGPGLD